MSTTCPRRLRGSALIVAVFLLVALAALGAFIAGISSSQHVGSAYDLQGARALQAARYGSEWGVYQVLRGEPGSPGHVAAVDCTTANTFCTLCRAGASTRNLSGLAGSLSGFTVTVSCSGTPATEGGTPVWIYQITANACTAPNAAGACPNTTAAAVTSIGYIERRISLTVTN